VVSTKQTKVYWEKEKILNNTLDGPGLAGELTSLTTSRITGLQLHGKKAFLLL